MGDQSYKAFEKIISNLQKRRILIFENKDQYNAYNIFSILRFNKKEKYIIVKYNEEFFPLISDFKKNFCKYKLKYIEPLTSKYSIMFYMLCKSNEFRKEFTLSVNEINEKIGKVIRSNNLEKIVLIPTIQEINQYTDISIEIIKERNGLKNKINGYKFIVSKKIIEVSDLLEKAIKKAKKNIYVNKSKMLNDESIQILLSEISEEELINGLNFAYEKINKDFTKLEYLKKVILSNENVSIKNEIEVLESENEVILDKQENLKDKKLKDEILKMEETLIEHLVKKENANKETLIHLGQIYENTLLRAYKEIKKEF